VSKGKLLSVSMRKVWTLFGAIHVSTSSIAVYLSAMKFVFEKQTVKPC